MHKLFWITAVFATFTGAQTFEVASIRPSAFQSGDGEGSRRESIEPSPDGLIMRNMTLGDCLSWAYRLPGFQISGAAASAVQRYDIAAKADTPLEMSREQARPCLQALLAERLFDGRGWRGDAAVLIRDGRIVAIEAPGSVPPDWPTTHLPPGTFLVAGGQSICEDKVFGAFHSRAPAVSTQITLFCVGRHSGRGRSPVLRKSLIHSS